MPVARRFRAALLCVCVGRWLAAAGSPDIADVSPAGGQRGTRVVLTVRGQHLADAREVLAYGPGISFAEPVPTADRKAVTVAADVAADCPLGEHAFRLRTATGVSDLVTWSVGALPVVGEKEPNDRADAPQPIPLNVTVHGAVGNEDQDHFAVDCRAGQRLAVEVEGVRLGRPEFWDPHVAVLDAAGRELAVGDDSPRTGQDGWCAIAVPRDGRYVVRVREAAYGNGGPYRLHVGTFPAPTTMTPLGGRPGKEVEFRFTGDPLGEFRQKVKLPDRPEAAFRVRPATADGVAPSGFAVRVADLPTVADAGTNTTRDAATVGPFPAAFEGVVGRPGEVRYFRFPGKKGQVVDVACFARRLGSPLDPVVAVTDARGKQLAANDDADGSPDSTVRGNLPADGEYVAAVRDHLSAGGPGHVFRLEVTPASPAVVLGVPRADPNSVQSQERQAFAVPRGGRFAGLLSVGRSDVAGPLAVGFADLPAGVTAAVDPVEPGRAVAPVVLTAAADAPPGGRLTALTVGGPVAARTRVEAAFSVGPGNTVFHRYDADRVAVAVCDPAPFRLDAVEPKAAVPQNGAIRLKVVATRQGGFAGPIQVQPLWAPPGVGVQGSATIPAGATEATLAVNAAANAAVKGWRTAVLGWADAGGGPVWASTDLFKLEVAPPLLAAAGGRVSVDQGQAVDVRCRVTAVRAFAGEATVSLVGLPAKASAEPVRVTTDAAEFVIPVATDKATPAGRHKLGLRLTALVNGEEVTQAVGGVELRVDAPAKPRASR